MNRIVNALLVLVALGAYLTAGGPVHATPPEEAAGNFMTFTQTPTSERTAGPNTFIELTETGELDGTFSGPYEAHQSIHLRKDGSMVLQGVVTCECVVEGRAGTLTFRINARGTMDDFEGRYVIIGGTDGLSNLHSQGSFEGTDVGGTYTGRFHFDPAD
jgi:hypothetical protein